MNLTLEGCRLPDGATLPGSLICNDAYYTTGNLGKSWNELDLVPHRLTTSLGSQADATIDYTLGVTADNFDGGHPGYDVFTAPVVNADLSDASCSVSPGPQTIITPGVGGTDSSIGRLFTIHQDKGSTCVFDWVERLALGSHLYPGSSLHTNRTDQLWSTQGVGAADVSIPVKEIAPQQLSKNMSATRGQIYGWDVAKEANPTSLMFDDTCDPSNGARSQDVEITITWTRSGPTGSGDTMITTHVYATNPAHRTITVTALDKIYEGSNQSVLLDTASGSGVDVPAFSTDYLILTHSFTYSGDATHFNDVATATYIDKITQIAVPGQTSATASADTVASQDPAANSSVVITDSESITGAHLSFSVAAPSVGSFSGYTAGDSTTGPVNWSSGPVSNSGSVTFTKTVSVDEPAITSGTLSDTATLTGDDQKVLDSASLEVPIEASATVSLAIDKSIPSDALRLGEFVTFNFDITGPDNYSGSASITFSYGGLTSKSATLSGLAPGQYTVHEQPKANWATQSDQKVTIALPACSDSVSFENSELAPDLTASKKADEPSTVNAGEQIGFTIDVSNSDAQGTGIAKDVMIDDPLPAGSGLNWSIDPAYAGPGTCNITGGVGAQSLSCDLGDLAPGVSVSVHIVSHTTAADCETYLNVASVTASNHAELKPEDSTTVECPGLNISKVAANDTIYAGDPASFEIVVWNTGPGSALNVTLHDPLPALGDGEVWTENSDDCAITDGVLDCTFGDLGVTTMENSTARVIVSTETTREDCGALDNTAFAKADNNEEIQASASITVKCPTLVIDKSADTEEVHFKFDVDGSLLSTTPEVVTWTLTYTLADGPVDNAVISDPLPAFLIYVDGSASDGGVYNPATRTITWTFPTLSDSGTVTFKTTTDPDAPEGKLIENVATIVSDQTVKDDGKDSILVTAEQVEAGTSSPSPSLPNSALGEGPVGQPVSIPVSLITILFLLGLGGLGFANVKAVRRRR